MGRITIATVKSFIRKNQGRLLVRFIGSFDPTIDCVTQDHSNKFEPAETPGEHPEHDLGIRGAWFVGRSRDYFTPIDADGLVGFHVYNSCGSFEIAVRR